MSAQKILRTELDKLVPRATARRRKLPERRHPPKNTVPASGLLASLKEEGRWLEDLLARNSLGGRSSGSSG
jgi:hypothetical protein